MSSSNENNIKISWQLISEFASWEFCRYVSEKCDQTTKLDVLTYFRNMIVERTEKGNTAVTKHEIIAKFLMELKAVKSLSGIPCITTLSETVKRICPELTKPIGKLLHHLEIFLNALDFNEDNSREEIIQLRKLQAVNEFATEAFKTLPLPDLIQIINCYLNPDLQSQLRKAKHRKAKDSDLYQKSVDCLKREILTAAEAKIIASALYEDKFLEQILLNCETESELESQQSLTKAYNLFLEKPSSPQNPKNTRLPDRQSNFTLSPSPPKKHTASPTKQKVLSQSPDKHLGRRCTPVLDSAESLTFEPSNENYQVSNVRFLDLNPPSNAATNHSDISFQESPPAHLSNMENNASRVNLENSGESSDSDFEQRIKAKSNMSQSKVKRKSARILSSESSSDDDIWRNVKPGADWFFKADEDSDDTSDVEKHVENRFLTPTIYKDNNKEFPKKQFGPITSIPPYSDTYSSISIAVDSQKDDPNFTLSKDMQKMNCGPNPAKRQKTSSAKNRKAPTNRAATLQQPSIRNFPGFNRIVNSGNKTQPSEAVRKNFFKLYDNDKLVLNNDSAAQFQDPKKKKTVKGQPQKTATRKLLTSSSSSASHDEINRPSTSYQNSSKQPANLFPELGNRRRCYICSITFNNNRELRRHHFVVHVSPDFDKE